jgi:Bacterial Ig-like domain (group 2)
LLRQRERNDTKVSFEEAAKTTTKKNMQQFNRKQKLIAGGCGTAVILGLVAVICTALYSTITWEFITATILGGRKPTPCLAYQFEDVNPLTVGKATQLSIGESNDSDCIPPWFSRLNKFWVWSSKNPEIVNVSPDGTVTGIAPGKFTVLAKKDQKTFFMSGTVYPPDWQLQIQPEMATVRVGDRITFSMIASDSKGKLLPPLPFGFRTPDYQQYQPNAPSRPPNPTPLLDRSFHQMGTQPGTFRALRPGKIAITGKMGDRTKSAKLTIK